MFPLPLTNTDALALPAVLAPSNPAASPEGPPVPAPAAAADTAATASLGAPAADALAEAEVMASFRSQMSWAARTGEHSYGPHMDLRHCSDIPDILGSPHSWTHHL